MRTPLVVMLAAVGLGSCNTFYPWNADQVCETEVHALCHFAYACCNATERVVFATAVDGFRNEGECVDFLLRDGTAECGNALAVQDAIVENRFSYDANLAQKCLQPTIDALNQCDAVKVVQPDAGAAACTGLGFGNGNFAFGKGKVAAGQACFQAFECSDPGSVCEVKPDDDADGKVVVTTVGVCKSPGKEGDDCSADTGTDGLCDAGLFCNADNVCEAIDLKDNGDACVQDAECKTDFCNDIASVADATCDDKIDNGEECKDNNDCKENICAVADGDDGLTCQAAPKLVVNACNGIQADDTAFGK
jgi:hypothetical protein